MDSAPSSRKGEPVTVATNSDNGDVENRSVCRAATKRRTAIDNVPEENAELQSNIEDGPQSTEKVSRVDNAIGNTIILIDKDRCGPRVPGGKLGAPRMKRLKALHKTANPEKPRRPLDRAQRLSPRIQNTATCRRRLRAR